MLRVLLVDDDRSVLDYLRRNLVEDGHIPEAATSIADARTLIDAFSFDVAILDLHLPDGNGTSLVSVIRETTPATKCIMITGFGTIRSAVEALRSGALDYLCKPFVFDELRQTLFRSSDRISPPAVEPQMTLHQARWEHIQRTLVSTNHNISESARRLGVTRQSLQRMLQKRPPPSLAKLRQLAAGS